MRGERARLQSTAEDRRKDFEEKSKDMTTLQAALDDLKAGGRHLELKFKEKVNIPKGEGTEN
jgi:hypothetical protein